MVPPSRGFSSPVQQVASASNRSLCYEIQQVAPVRITSSGPHGHCSGCTQFVMGKSGRICLPTDSHIGQSGGEVAGLPIPKVDHHCPGWPNMTWFWDLLEMSSQIPLFLPPLPNLLTQPLNQTPHRSLTNLNLHAWLLEPQLSRSRVSLRRWQQELRLLKEDQPDLSMRQSGPFLQSGASQIRWTSGYHL